MGFVLLLVVVALLAYAGSCTMAGMQPSPVRLPDYIPDPAFGALVRHFHGEPDAALHSFADAVRNAPGMSVIDESAGVLLVDSKPSMFVMDGNYGVVVQLSFRRPSNTDPRGQTEMTVDAAPKVSWAFATRQRSSLIEIERRLRMSAKQQGTLSEIVG